MQLLWGVKTARGYALLIGAGSMFKLILRIYRCRCPLFFLDHDVPVVAGLSHGAKLTAYVTISFVICGTCWDSTTVSYSALVADPCRVQSCFFHFGDSLLPIELLTLWWSEMHDLNVRPSAPKADALPGCANLGYKEPLSAILEMWEGPCCFDYSRLFYIAQGLPLHKMAPVKNSVFP